MVGVPVRQATLAGRPVRQPYAGVNYIPPFRDNEFGYSIRTGLYRVDVSPTDMSPTENSWMLRPLNKASLGYCVPDQCVPTLDRVRHETSSVGRVGRYRGLGRPPAPNESVGRLAGFAYAPDQIY